MVKIVALPVKLDTQTKLCLLFFANIMAFYHLPFSAEFISVTFLLLAIFLNGSYQRGITYTLIYLSCIGLEYLLNHQHITFLVQFLSFYAITFRRLLPLFMMGGFFMATTKVSTLIYTLRKWHVPEFIVIPLSVLFRFFPTLKIDYRHIREAMQLRGIALSSWDMLKHPLVTLEYIIVPMLMSASITAVDLSAASLTRGITNPGKHTTIAENGMVFYDYLLILTGLILTFGRSLI